MAAKSRWFLTHPLAVGKCMHCTAQARGFDNIGLPFCCERCYHDAQSCDCALRQRQSALAEELPVSDRGIGK